MLDVPRCWTGRWAEVLQQASGIPHVTLSEAFSPLIFPRRPFTKAQSPPGCHLKMPDLCRKKYSLFICYRLDHSPMHLQCQCLRHQLEKWDIDQALQKELAVIPPDKHTWSRCEEAHSRIWLVITGWRNYICGLSAQRQQATKQVEKVIKSRTRNPRRIFCSFPLIKPNASSSSEAGANFGFFLWFLSADGLLLPLN